MLVGEIEVQGKTNPGLRNCPDRLQRHGWMLVIIKRSQFCRCLTARFFDPMEGWSSHDLIGSSKRAATASKRSYIT